MTVRMRVRDSVKYMIVVWTFILLWFNLDQKTAIAESDKLISDKFSI